MAADGGKEPERPKHYGRYVLVDRVPVPEPDLFRWAMWIEQEENRRVRHTQLGSWHVSTVFLGLDHSFGYGDPVLFETMCYKEDRRNRREKHRWYDYQARYHSWDAAVDGHAELVVVVNRVRAHRCVQDVIDWWPEQHLWNSALLMGERP